MITEGIRKYREEARARRYRLRLDLQKKHSVPEDHPKAARLFDLAWDYGHAHGAHEVECYYWDLVDLLGLEKPCTEEQQALADMVSAIHATGASVSHFRTDGNICVQIWCGDTFWEGEAENLTVALAKAEKLARADGLFG